MAMTIFNVGIKGVIAKDGKVLLVRESGREFWEVPGGRVDENETIEEALLRELNEELPGIKDVHIGDILAAHRVPGLLFGDRGLFLVCYEVNAEIPDMTELSDEHDQFAWLPFDEAIEKVAPDFRPAIARLRDRVSA